MEDKINKDLQLIQLISTKYRNTELLKNEKVLKSDSDGGRYFIYNLIIELSKNTYDKIKEIFCDEGRR